MKGNERKLRHKKRWHDRHESDEDDSLNPAWIPPNWLVEKRCSFASVWVEKTQPSSVEVIVDRAEGSVYSDKTSDSDPELDSSDWEYFHSLMLVRSVISSFLLNVWSSSSISARVGLREILRVILLARDLSLFFLDSLWMESLMLNNCFIRLISCVLISLNSVCSVANAALTLSVAEINSIVNVNVRGTEFLVVWLFWLYRGF